MPASYDALRLQNQKHFDERLTADHARLAQAIAMLVIHAAGSDGLIPNTARESLRAAIWTQVLKPFYVGSGTDALIGPAPQSPYARLIVDGITVATRIQAERQVAIVKRVCHDAEVVEWLTGPRPSGVLTVPTTVLPQRALAGIAFNPSTNALGGLRGPDGRIDVPRATAALVKVRGVFDPYFRWVDPNGYRLSDRIWTTSISVRSRIEAMLEYEIGRGTSAVDIAKLLEPFMTTGGRLAKTSKPYGSQGSYSARRLARSELTVAAHDATVNASIANPFVGGIQWRLSGSHPDMDICDELAHGGPNGDGIYPLDKVPAVPHPHCLCSQLPVPVGSTTDLVKSLRADIQAARGNLLDAVRAGGNAARAESLQGILNPEWLTQSIMSGSLLDAIMAVIGGLT